MVTATNSRISDRQIRRVVDAVIDTMPSGRLARLMTAVSLQKRISRCVVHGDGRSELRVEYRLGGIVWSLDFVREAVPVPVWKNASGRTIAAGMLTGELESMYLDVLDVVDGEAGR